MNCGLDFSRWRTAVAVYILRFLLVACYLPVCVFFLVFQTNASNFELLVIRPPNIVPRVRCVRKVVLVCGEGEIGIGIGH
jgi:hypothetical protein